MKNKLFPEKVRYPSLWLFCLFIILFTGIEVDYIFANDEAQLTQNFLSGTKAYEKGDFNNAISDFTQIAAKGIDNGKLFYNIANAYLKNDQLGNAILWYERAFKLIPNDPDLKFNLSYARSLIKDEREEDQNLIFRVLFFLKDLFSPFFISVSAVLVSLIFWTLMTIRIVKRIKMFNFAVLIALFFTVVFSFTAFFNYYEEKYVISAVILPDKLSVRSGLTDDSTELFVLHAGTKVKIDKQSSEFVRIYFSHDKIGWVKSSKLGVI